MGVTPDSIAAALGTEAHDLVQLPGGASRETYSFTANGTRFILRRDPPGTITTGVGLQMEVRLITAALEAGVPVPKIIAHGDDLEGGPFMILEHIEGETIPRKILRSLENGEHLLEQSARALASIHSMKVEALEHHDPLAWVRTILDDAPSAHPAFELAVRWLNEHRPKSFEKSVVHGDFRLGNWIVKNGELKAVLDWELAHIGDPLEDLGWMCVKAWRFGSPLPAAGIGTVEKLINAYGRPIDPQALKWWQVMGTIRWGAICIVQCNRHLSGKERSVELAAIGRRVCEVEWDVLGLIA